MLRRWGPYLAYDPYFPPALRDLHYRDSQEPYALHPGHSHASASRATGPDVLLVSHDLSSSGAPRIVLDLARVLLASGCYVCVVAPSDGPMRHLLTELGADVIVDELLLTQNASAHDFARDFDLAIVNTVVGWPFAPPSGWPD